MNDIVKSKLKITKDIVGSKRFKELHFHPDGARIFAPDEYEVKVVIDGIQCQFTGIEVDSYNDPIKQNISKIDAVIADLQSRIDIELNLRQDEADKMLSTADVGLIDTTKESVDIINAEQRFRREKALREYLEDTVLRHKSNLEAEIQARTDKVMLYEQQTGKEWKGKKQYLNPDNLPKYDEDYWKGEFNATYYDKTEVRV